MTARVTGLRTRGQASALAAVERSISSERPPHALLLVGPRGVGKTTLALDLAAGLLCLATDPAARPCRQCSACHKVDSANHPDLHLLAPKGAGQQVRIGQVHELAAALALLPLEGRFRVAIVESAQRLNLDAQNALLKTLEEPHDSVVLILAADDSASLLPTVVSRCARLRLGPVAPAVVGVMVEEAGLADPVQAAVLARLSAGRPGVALSLAEQPEVVVAHGRLARSLLALLDADHRRRLSLVPELLADGALLAGATDSGASGAMTSDKRPTAAERRAAAGRLVGLWRDLARDLALAARGARAELSQHQLFDELIAAAARVEPDQVTRFVQRLDRLSRALDGYANPELAIDVLLLEWPRARQAA
jgi:DNA polymerase III subunit delta'